MPGPTLFSEIRRSRIHGLLAFVPAHVALKAWFFSPAFASAIANPVYEATRGHITHSASAGIVETTILLPLLWGIARLRPSDVGLLRWQLPSGIVVTLFVWAVAQTAIVAVGRVDGALLAYGRAWYLSGASIGAGLLDAHAGGAFIEEVIYRGFLMPQIFLALCAYTGWNTSRCIVTAVVTSQTYFALNHLPAAVVTFGETWAGASLYLFQVFLVGILFAVVYIRSSNLFVAIGLHALLNFPAELFTSRIDPFVVVLILCCAIIISWPYLNRSMGDVFTLRPSAWRPSPLITQR